MQGCREIDGSRKQGQAPGEGEQGERRKKKKKWVLVDMSLRHPLHNLLCFIMDSVYYGRGPTWEIGNSLLVSRTLDTWAGGLEEA